MGWVDVGVTFQPRLDLIFQVKLSKLILEIWLSLEAGSGCRRTVLIILAEEEKVEVVSKPTSSTTGFALVVSTFVVQLSLEL